MPLHTIFKFAKQRKVNIKPQFIENVNKIILMAFVHKSLEREP